MKGSERWWTVELIIMWTLRPFQRSTNTEWHYVESFYGLSTTMENSLFVVY